MNLPSCFFMFNNLNFDTGMFVRSPISISVSKINIWNYKFNGGAQASIGRMEWGSLEKIQQLICGRSVFSTQEDIKTMITIVYVNCM